MSGPAPLIDRGVGEPPRPGIPIEVAPAVIRLTAPNPSMMTGPGTNSYLIGDRSLIVVDPGPDDATHRRRLVELVAGRQVTAIVVTHTHPDHAPGAQRLAAVLGAAKMGFASGPDFEPDRRLVDGERLDADGRELLALHTPGHASDHLCYLLEEEGLIFTGDHLMQGSTVVIRPPDGDLGAYLDSLVRLRSIEPTLRAVAPGHGRIIADPIGAIDDVVAHRLAREVIVEDALIAAGTATAPSLLDAVYPGLDEPRRDVATATLWAHLRHLVSQGRATTDGGLDETGLAASFSSSTEP